MSNKSESNSSPSRMADKSTEKSSSVPATQKPVSKPTSQKPSTQTVTVKNNTRGRIIELDFGRDKEVRILPGQTGTFSKDFLKHPSYVAVKGNLSVLK